MKSVKIFFLSTFLIFGCSSSTETTKSDRNNNLTTSKDLHSNSLRFTIPPGWREIKDNSDQLFEIWLINNQKNAAIGFIPIYLHGIDSKSTDENLKILLDISINKKQTASTDFELLNKEFFEVNNLKIAELKYLLDNNIQNLLIFSNGNQYYKCLAYFNDNYDPTDSEIENLLTVQQQIISELVTNITQ